MVMFREPFPVATGCTIRDREGHTYRVGPRVEPLWWHGGAVLFHVTRLDTGETREVNRRVIWEVCTLVSHPPVVRHRERKVAHT